MSVKKRLNKYWLNDLVLGHRITDELGWPKRSGWDTFLERMKQHRLNGKMCRYHKKYMRLIKRGHTPPVVEKMVEGVLPQITTIS